MPDALQTPIPVSSLTALAVELGMISHQEAVLTEARREALRRGGIKLTLGQTMIERHFLEPFQIRQLMKEHEKREAHSAVPREAHAEIANRKFGPYELIEVLSEKTHSRIVKARDTVMDRLVVLKILPNTLKNDPQWAERFRRETHLLGKMAHPNLVQAYAAQDIEGCPVIAMEYVEGSTVGDRIENEGYLPEKEAWLIGREVAKALAYSARLGILHRDIKPDNIVCSRGGKVKLIDMGFSKSLTDTTNLTVEGTTVGTPFYISPEQARGTRDLDPRTDIYSLGCTIYHMLAGAPPFWGDEITEVMLKHIEAKRPDPRGMISEISAASAELVMRMMSARPEKRPQTAEAVAEEITTLLPTLPKLFNPPPPVMQLPRKNQSEILRIPAQAPAPETNGTSAEKSPGFWSRLKEWLGL